MRCVHARTHARTNFSVRNLMCVGVRAAEQKAAVGSGDFVSKAAADEKAAPELNENLESPKVDNIR